MAIIGIIKEGKIPVDHRVPFTPAQVAQIKKQYPDVGVKCQSSALRCFSDDDYMRSGTEIVDHMRDCDILFGVKEVPLDELIPGKTYFFFSHTLKAQPYNRKLLQEILKKKITIIDYEALIDEHNNRVVAFGRYAGIVGAYNALWTFGKRYNLFHIRRAHECFDFEDMKTEFAKVKLPPIKIALTGGGRVAKGALEVLYGLGLRKVSAKDFLKKEFKQPIFSQLNSRDIYRRADREPFERREFFSDPALYESRFLPFARRADVLIAGAYWDPRAPKLFTREDMLKRKFHIKVIADITCDINGSIPSTKRACTIADPIYDYCPSDDSIEPPLSDEGQVTVMAIDNLPCELPRDASNDFGRDLINKVLPHLLGAGNHQMIENATIASNGSLTKKFDYLSSYVKG
ncbi:MAG: NAD(P)-dependent oxidoreductase [Cyclobacteriaceae bacterium]|nr:NAD(P)-dependent oxidoreductase [Cyclobacteriaceae bacterium]